METNKILPTIALKGIIIFPSSNASFEINKPKAVKALNKAMENSTDLFLVACKKISEDEPVQNNIYTVGTVVKIRQVLKLTNENIRILVGGQYRAKIVNFVNFEEYLECETECLFPQSENVETYEAYGRVLTDLFVEYSKVDSRISNELINIIRNTQDGNAMIDIIAQNVNFNISKKQKLLEETDTEKRMSTLSKILMDEIEIVKLEKRIGSKVKQRVDKNQKEYFLREQLKVIHEELGDDENEMENLRNKILKKNMPKEAEEKALKELAKLDKIPGNSPEVTVIRNYLDYLLELPFTEKTTDTQSLKRAKEILNEDHYGLEKVKERILEYLAVFKLTKSLRSPILCFIGPPGVGKTSVAKSVARALNRKFVRMSLGGIHDEAEIRGHRRTYIGSMPGRIMYNMKIAKTINPVFLLDEIDKTTSDMRGDPASALLEVLDPEQNSTFRDNYLEVPYDLSHILFITTANTTDGIPPPLLDRMEVIEISGYTEEEKLEIAKQYLVVKKMKENGVTPQRLEITDRAIVKIIRKYTMESGVRNLEREIGSVCRKVASVIAENEDESKKIIITEENLSDFLGIIKYQRSKLATKNIIGEACGLAWTAVGGTTLNIEVSISKGKGEIILTGKLGDIMKESARAAISYIRSKSELYGIDAEVFLNNDIHIHVPEGATPKDGPSAGITIATAILSALIKKPVDHSVAMTGEITLLGRVLPIGGLKEKALAAHRAGIKKVIIPTENEKDMEEIPSKIKEEINFILTDSADFVFQNSILY